MTTDIDQLEQRLGAQAPSWMNDAVVAVIQELREARATLESDNALQFSLEREDGLRAECDRLRGIVALARKWSEAEDLFEKYTYGDIEFGAAFQTLNAAKVAFLAAIAEGGGET